MQAPDALVNGSRLQTVLGAAGLLLLAAFVLRVFAGPRGPFALSGGIRVRVAFSRLANLETKAPVKVGASTAGFVESIEWRPRENRVWVTLYLDARLARRIPVNSRIYQDGVTPIGGRHIAIAPPDASEEPGRPLADGDERIGEDPFPVELLSAMMMRASGRIDGILQEAAPGFHAVGRRFLELHGFWLQAEFLPRLETLLSRAAAMEPPGLWVRELARVRNAVSASLLKNLKLDAILAQLAEIVAELEKNGRMWKDSRLQVRLNRLRDRVQGIAHQAEQLQAQLDILNRHMAAEAGTLHAFMRDPSMYNDLRQMARRLKNAPLDLLLKRTERRETPSRRDSGGK